MGSVSTHAAREKKEASDHGSFIENEQSFKRHKRARMTPIQASRRVLKVPNATIEDCSEIEWQNLGSTNTNEHAG